MPQREDFNLRHIEESDLPLVLTWRNAERIRANMYTDHVISLEEHQLWFAATSTDEKAQHFIFEYKGKPIGIVNIVQIDKRNKKCYWGFYLGEIDVPRASGAVMEFLALEYIFERLDIRKLYCEVFIFNETVIKLHKKFGFFEEGRFMEHILKNDKYEDVISLATFKQNWIVLKQKLEKICFRD